MNTPAHLLFGAAAFARPQARWVTIAAFAGAFVPDLSLYAMVGWALYVQDIAPQVVFGELYFSDLWQQVFAVDNSFVLWGLGVLVALWARRPVWVAFTGAALLHLALDFPLHHDDARMHFWPISRWVFESPLSYWDGRHHGAWVGMVEVAASFACAGLLWRRFSDWGMRVFVAVLLTLETASSGFWSFIF